MLDKFIFTAYGETYFGAGQTHFLATDENLSLLASEIENYRREHTKKPCGECHLKPGEICDICGITNRL